MKRQMVIFVDEGKEYIDQQIRVLWRDKGKDFQSLRPFVWITPSIFEACALIRQNMGGVTDSNTYDQCLVLVSPSALENKDMEWYKRYESGLNDVYTHNVFAQQAQQARINFFWSHGESGIAMLPWDHLYPWWTDTGSQSLSRVDSRKWLCKLSDTKPVTIKWLTQLDVGNDYYTENVRARYRKLLEEFIASSGKK